MNRAVAELPECRKVLSGRVSFVPGEAILGVEEIVTFHQSIPEDLGNDRGSRNTEGAIIPPHNGRLIRTELRYREAIDQYVVGADSHRAEGSQHGNAAGVENIYAIDDERLNGSNTVTHSVLNESGKEIFASPTRESLRVSKPLNQCVFEQDHTGSDNGAGQWASSHFIHSGDPMESLSVKCALEGEH
jgi:hypothetical protein